MSKQNKPHLNRKHAIGRGRLNNDLMERRVYEVTENAKQALRWWLTANKHIQLVALDMLDELKRFKNHQVGFWEWLTLCPLRPIRWIGRKFKPAVEYEKVCATADHSYLKWRTDVILGGDKKYTMESAAKELGVDMKKVQLILNELQEDKKKEEEEETKRQMEEIRKEEQARALKSETPPLMMKVVVEGNVVAYHSIDGGVKNATMEEVIEDGITQLQSDVIVDHVDYPNVKIQFYKLLPVTAAVENK